MKAFLCVVVYVSVMLAEVFKCLLKTVIYTVNFVTGHIQS